MTRRPIVSCMRQTADPRPPTSPVHSRILSGNLIIGFKSAEVVDPDRVRGRRRARAPHREILPCLSQLDRVSQSRPVAESVRRASATTEMLFAIQLEVLRMAQYPRPYDIDRQIADYTDRVCWRNL